MNAINSLSPAKCLAHFSPDSLSWTGPGRWAIDQMHPDGPRCPHCQVVIAEEKRLERWYQCERLRCKEAGCRRFFTSLTGTILHSSKLDPREIYFLAALSALEVPAARIAVCMGIHRDTVRNWQEKFQAQAEAAGV